MRALTIDEFGFVSGGNSDYWSDPLFGDGGPLMPYSPSIVLGGTYGYGSIADDSMFSTGGVGGYSGFGANTTSPASNATTQSGWSRLGVEKQLMAMGLTGIVLNIAADIVTAISKGTAKEGSRAILAGLLKAAGFTLEAGAGALLLIVTPSPAY
jgi:hypothetical protein